MTSRFPESTERGGETKGEASRNEEEGERGMYISFCGAVEKLDQEKYKGRQRIERGKPETGQYVSIHHNFRDIRVK